MKRVAIFGASGCGRGVMPLVRAQFKDHITPFELVFVDDNPSATSVNGHQILTYADWMKRPASSRHINIAIANCKIREMIVQRCENDGVNFFEVRADSVVQMDDVQIKEGGILCPFVTLTSNIRIGKHFHANLYSYIEHDCVIGDFVTFAPGVKCNGNVHIEDYAYIGAGAVIKQGSHSDPLIIGKGAVIGMGSVVTRSVSSGAIVVGNPAKPISK